MLSDRPAAMPLETIRLFGVAAHVDHLGAGIGLLAVVGDGDGVELAHRIVALQDAARILPGDRGPGLHLGPGDLGVGAAAGAALGDEVVDPTPALGVARIPVLHGGILDLGVIESDQLDHGRMKLVLVPHRRRTAFEIAHVRALVSDDQRALELAGVGRVDAEVGGKLHRAAHALRHVDEGAVGEDRRIQRREEVVRIGHHGAKVALHKRWMLLHRLRDRAEDDAHLGELVLEGGGDRDAVEHRVHGDAGQHLPAPGVEYRASRRSSEQLRVDLVQALWPIHIGLGRGVIAGVLIIDGRIVQLGPGRLLIFHLKPALRTP